jgi:Glutamate racemase
VRRSPVALFDSGVGGLTVLKQVEAKLPFENFLYFADTARLPYGPKGKETICRYAYEIASFLTERDAKLIVIACNTASAHGAEFLRQTFSIPILDVIEPAVIEACCRTRNKKIAVFATRGTITSGIFQKKSRAI